MTLLFKNYVSLSPHEHKSLLEIRNAERVRLHMKRQTIIALQEHLNWVEQLKSDIHNSYFALFLDDTLVGAIYITDIDFEKKTAFWGLYFQENIHPFASSLATYLIIERVFHDLGLEKLYLEVKKSNTNAYKFDLNFGFKVDGEHEESGTTYIQMSMNEADWERSKLSGLPKTIRKKVDKITYQFT